MKELLYVLISSCFFLSYILGYVNTNIYLTDSKVF